MKPHIPHTKRMRAWKILNQIEMEAQEKSSAFTTPQRYVILTLSLTSQRQKMNKRYEMRFFKMKKVI